MKNFLNIILIKTIFVFVLFLSFSQTSLAALTDPHPRLYLNDTNMANLVSMLNNNNPKWTAMISALNAPTSYFLPSERIISNALAYKVYKANGDINNANIYKNKALDYIFNGLGGEHVVTPIIITGTFTGLDMYHLTDSSILNTPKEWITSSAPDPYVANNLNVYGMNFINPNVKQNKYWYRNIAESYGRDNNFGDYTATEYYVHPDPSLPLGTFGEYSDEFWLSDDPNTGAEKREIDMTTVIEDGEHKYAIVNASEDGLKSTAHGMAIAYDWLYDDLTVEQKDFIRAYLVIAGTEASRMRNGLSIYSMTNYTTDNMRDITAIAYALYNGSDTDPTNLVAVNLLNYVKGKYESQIKPSLNWITNGGVWPEGETYGSASVYGWILFMQMVKDVEGIDYFSASETQLKARLDYLAHIHYPTATTKYSGFKYKPAIVFSDGLRDQPLSYDSNRLSAFLIINAFPNSREAKTAMSFFDGLDLQTNGITRVEAPYMLCWEMLFFPTSQIKQSVDSIPLENASLDGGVIQMRSSWTDVNPTVAIFKSSPHTHYHGHLDANSFQIYKYADLAADTGTYSGSGGSPGTEYYYRTVAHNAMLFYDSAEVFDNIQNAPNINDGGQRSVQTYTAGGLVLKKGAWQTSAYTTGYSPFIGNEDVYQHGKITAYGAGTNYVYTSGDASSAYDGNTHKVTKAIRKFLYIRPDIFVVHDVFNLKNTSIKPSFVIHSVDGLDVNNGNETVIEPNGQYDYTQANKITITNENGKLVMDTIYPQNNNISKIGGAICITYARDTYDEDHDGDTNEFTDKCIEWQSVRRYWVDGADRETGSGDYGLWRAEVTPASITTTGQMLNVLQTTSSSGTTLSTTAIEGTNARGTLIGNNIVAMFSNAQSGTVSNMSYSAITTGASTHYIADLIPNQQYNISINGNVSIYTSSDAGIIEFENSNTGSQTYSITAGPIDETQPSSPTGLSVI